MESTFLSSPGRPLRLGDAVLLKKFIIHKNAVLATPAPRPAAVGTGHAFCFIVLEIAFFFCQNGFDVFIYFGEYNFQ